SNVSTLSSLFGAPAGIRTPNQQIMRRFEGHRQGETKRDKPAFTNPQPSKFVTTCYVSARHRAIIASSLIVRLAYSLGRRQVLVAFIVRPREPIHLSGILGRLSQIRC